MEEISRPVEEISQPSTGLAVEENSIFGVRRSFAVEKISEA